jgi:aryl-alcohol dehydrogenase-like predicted oxidoreductase
MAELVQAGKVRHLGLSEVNSEQLRRAYRRAPHHRGAVRVLPVDPRPRDRGPGYAARARRRAVAYSPLGRGLPDRDGQDRLVGRQGLPRPQPTLRR